MLIDEHRAQKIVESRWSKYELIPPQEMEPFSSLFPEVLAYVQSKTDGARMLQRRDINPAEIMPLLPDLVILDVVESDDGEAAGRDYIFRLMGTNIAEFYGELTGKSVRQLPNKQAVDRLLHACNTVMENGESQGILARSLSEDEQYLQAVALYIPMVNDDNDIVKILLAAVVTSTADRNAVKGIAT